MRQGFIALMDAGSAWFFQRLGAIEYAGMKKWLSRGHRCEVSHVIASSADVWYAMGVGRIQADTADQRS
jgi:hypothetical protein